MQLLRFLTATAAVCCVGSLALGQSLSRDLGPADRAGSSSDVPETHDARWWLLERPLAQPLGFAFEADPRWTLDVGGSVREQYEGYRNFELAVDEELRGWDDYHLHRLLLHADLRFDDRVRFFGEFGNSTIAGNDREAGPVDQDEAYLSQAFLELALDGSFNADQGVGLRLGRQEIILGSGRLASSRDGPNLRRSFDAARLGIWNEDFSLDFFGGAEVRIREDNFDNRPDDDVLFWGVYATLHDVVPDGHLDLYYLGLDRDRAVFDAGVGREIRHSVGARFFGELHRFDYNVEPVIQFGEFAGQDILAWTLATDTGFRLGDGERAPRIGLRANVISGGDSDGQLNTFNALFPNNSYFSEAAIFAPANLFDVIPTLTVYPSDDFSVTLMWDFLWRYDTDDAIYGPPGIPLIAGDVSDARFIGHSISLLTEYEVSERLRLFASYTHFEAGAAVKRGGGRDQDYFLFGVEWSF